MPNAMLLRALAAACMLGVLAPRARADEDEPTKFNNAIAAYNRQLNEAGKKFGQELAPALRGEAANLERVRKEFKAVVDALKKVKKENAALKVPDSDSGRRLAKAYANFLKGQEQMVTKDLKGAVKDLEQVNPPDEAGRQRLITTLQAIAAREQTDLRELQEAQRVFAREHGITLRDNNP